MNTLAYFFAVVISIWAAEVRADSCSSQTVPLYRDYNSAISDHFYTTDISEYDSANQGGYTAEGVRLSVFSTQVPGSVQFIRLWNGDIGDHFYTTNATEAQAATGGGYSIENKATMYIYPTQICGSVPLYRLYSSGGSDHFYTIDASERDGAEGSGWAYEWIAGYVFPASGAPNPGTTTVNTPTTTTATKATTTTATTATTATTTNTAAAASNPNPNPESSGTTTPTSAAGGQTPVSSPTTGVAAPSDVGITGPVLPASTTLLGGSAADNAPSGSATGSSGAASIRIGYGASFIALLAVAATWM